MSGEVHAVQGGRQDARAQAQAAKKKHLDIGPGNNFLDMILKVQVAKQKQTSGIASN